MRFLRFAILWLETGYLLRWLTILFCPGKTFSVVGGLCSMRVSEVMSFIYVYDLVLQTAERMIPFGPMSYFYSSGRRHEASGDAHLLCCDIIAAWSD